MDRPKCVVHPVSDVIRSQFDEYFAGKRFVFNIRLSLEGVTSFCAAVYKALERVSHGEVCTYKDMARWVGIVGGARAVGQALRRNPLPIVIPCHRVIASDGSLGGFSLGLYVKRWLIEREKKGAEPLLGAQCTPGPLGPFLRSLVWLIYATSLQ
ncbi:MAG: methylated-DNA--[protein]-cysteine S-methyltransferase [Nitrospirae bacterium]|nr:methylated-DNA--[protein]-cysteine S-methyltransferase [Nitrospirota bacterium]